MHATNPELAQEFEKKTPKGKKLPEKVDEDIEETFERELNEALGLLDEAAPKDRQATTRPRKGATRGASKGATRRLAGDRKEEDVEQLREG
jgi:hypothetical protein